MIKKAKELEKKGLTRRAETVLRQSLGQVNSEDMTHKIIKEIKRLARINRVSVPDHHYREYSTGGLSHD